jgi:penicillin-binding protein 1A
VLGVVASGVVWINFSREADQHLTMFSRRVPPAHTKVLDNKGNVIGIFANQKRTVIPYDDIPKAFQGAIVAAEDADFWTHGGVSSRGFFGAIYRGVKSLGKDRSGFSTLTMQLVRTVTEKRERNLLKGGLTRKLREIFIARALERIFSKQQIMEQYANEVNFGARHYGIEAASQYYFLKSAASLNIEESALLAAMVQRPSKSHDRLFSTDPAEREIVRNRRNYVISRMAAEGYLKEQDAELLKERPIRLGRENTGEEDIAAYAVEEVRKMLEPVYGAEMLMEGGLVIHTTIDSIWQQAATDAVQKGLREVDRLRGFRKEAVRYYENPHTAKDPSWQRSYEPGDTARGIIMGWDDGVATVRMDRAIIEVPSSAFAWAGRPALEELTSGAAPLFTIKEVNPDGTPKFLELDQVPEVEGALLAIDNRTGEIRAMVGGYNFRRSQFNRATQAVRQVGSTMKAFVYGAALSEGYTPATLVEDTPISFQLVKDPPRRIEIGRTHYQPKNIERDFWGPITFWEALSQSRNIPAVKALEMASIKSAVNFAKNCGIESYIPPYPSLALGATDLTLQEMTRGYATIASGGYKCPEPFLIKKVVDRNGQLMEERSTEPRNSQPSVDPIASFQLIQMLQGVTSSGTANGTSALLNWPVAGKTGTTDDYTDAWFMGFSTRVTCGVWVGLDTKKTIRRGATGGRIALPIWKGFMGKILKTTPREDFKPPPGMEWVDIDMDTGLRAGSGTRRMRTLAFRPSTAPLYESSPDAVAMAAEAKARARAKLNSEEQRMWGAPKKDDAPPQEQDFGMFDPNHYGE